MPSRRYLPEFATSKAQNTRRGPRPGLAFAPWCACGPSAFHAAEIAREDGRPGEKSLSFVLRKQSETYIPGVYHLRQAVYQAPCNRIMYVTHDN